MSGIFESHAHYEDEAFSDDREALIASLRDNGIEYVVNVGSSADTCHKTVELVDKYPFFYGALGIHPSDVDCVTEEDWRWIEDTCREHPRIVAVGEAGLDYYWEKDNRKRQLEVFDYQIEMAKRLGLPLIVHSRDAALDTYTMMKESDASKAGGVVHCFSYHTEEAKKYLDLGFYIGVGGSSTFKNAQKVRDVVKYTPLERILLETDCPYLSPVPNRGRRNSSLNLPIIAQNIADIKGIDTDEVVEVTAANAKRMYGII